MHDDNCPSLSRFSKSSATLPPDFYIIKVAHLLYRPFCFSGLRRLKAKATIDDCDDKSKSFPCNEKSPLVYEAGAEKVIRVNGTRDWISGIVIDMTSSFKVLGFQAP